MRRKYLQSLHSSTGRNIILYSTAWIQKPQQNQPQVFTITDEDIDGLMEVTSNLDGDALDLILHSPGGSPESAESVVQFLRSKFGDIRIIVPHAAMSAATMICCAANEILMGPQSSLGPVDPQVILDTPTGRRSVAAQSILDQFKMAKEECQKPSNLGYWTPILRQYGPSLLKTCQEARELSRELVKDWAKSYMFSAESPEDAITHSANLADALLKRKKFKSHSRHIGREEARDYGFNISDLENASFAEEAMSVYFSAVHTHSQTDAAKIIENHLGKAFVKHVRQIQIRGRKPKGEEEQAKKE